MEVKKQLEKIIANGTDFETFYTSAPKLNLARNLIKGAFWGGSG